MTLLEFSRAFYGFFNIETDLIIARWQPVRHDTSCANAVKAVSGDDTLATEAFEERSMFSREEGPSDKAVGIALIS